MSLIVIGFSERLLIYGYKSANLELTAVYSNSPYSFDALAGQQANLLIQLSLEQNKHLLKIVV